LPHHSKTLVIQLSDAGWHAAPGDALVFPKQKKTIMKKIEAIIRQSRFDSVRDALAKIGLRFFTLKEVKGYGLQKGEKIVYRGSSYDADYIARLQLDILADDEMVDQIVATIADAARTGEVGDGKITVFDVQQVVRIRTMEMGKEAV
jgi:nitrogen regulatory protein PII